MPRLACWKCGRQLYTVAPLEALFAEERRCPRCGAFLRTDRRETERRQVNRRVNPRNDPGPPEPPTPPPDGSTAAKGKGAKKAGPADGAAERRVADRRTGQRRQDGNAHPRPGTAGGSGGWQD